MLSLIVFSPLFFTTPIYFAGSVLRTPPRLLVVHTLLGTGLLMGLTGTIFSCWSSVLELFFYTPSSGGFYPLPGVGEVFVYRFNTWTSWPTLMDFAVRFDTVGIYMGFTVWVVWILVFCFSEYYMESDPHKERFYTLLGCFAFCMQCLVTSESLWQLFISWELVGLCSYLLINFWYTRTQANKAALKAILVNRFGDFFLLLAVIFSWEFFGSFDIDTILQVSTGGGYANTTLFNFFGCNFTPLDTVGICLVVASMSKSAQFGLHTWLPDAMEGPTPVSALLHAATMVTAGVLLLIKMSPLLNLSDLCLNFLLIIGSLTAVFAASTATAQTDIKKVIAFSTCSQLGYMFMSCGAGHFSLAFFHLLTHAFFKALLFLSAGVVIHTLGGEQDLRKMGGLQVQIPFIFTAMGIASASLSGIPYLSGYYSKDLIIGVLCLQQTWTGYFAACMSILAAFFTSFYSARLLFLVFRGPARSGLNKQLIANAHATPNFFAYFPIMILTLFSVVFGFFVKDSLVAPDLGLSPHFLDEFNNRANLIIRAEYLPIALKVVILCSSFSGFFFLRFSFPGLGFHKLSTHYCLSKNT